MKKFILPIAIISLICSCTPAVKDNSKGSQDSVSVSVDTLPACCDTAKCDTVCSDTTLKK